MPQDLHIDSAVTLYKFGLGRLDFMSFHIAPICQPFQIAKFLELLT